MVSTRPRNERLRGFEASQPRSAQSCGRTELLLEYQNQSAAVAGLSDEKAAPR
jgi:hypothetical protein